MVDHGGGDLRGETSEDGWAVDPAREETIVFSSISLWRGEVSSSSTWKPGCGLIRGERLD